MLFNRTIILPYPSSRIFVFGDVHGHFQAVEALLIDSEYDPDSDVIIFVGDIIDRGPDSLACLRRLYQNNVYSCLGNHEHFAQLVSSPDSDLAHRWRINGGEWFFEISGKKQQEVRNIIDQHIAWTLQFYWQDKKIGVVHADVPPGVSWRSLETTHPEFVHPELKHHILWSRERAKRQYQHDIPDIDLILTGHNVVRLAERRNNVFLLDTGATGIGRATNIIHPRLSALIFSDTIHLKCIDEQFNIHNSPCELHTFLTHKEKHTS